MKKTYLRSYLEINVDNIKHNINYFKERFNKKLIGIVKANGYGTSDIVNAGILLSEGVDILAVASLEEALRLRDAKINCEILILGYVAREDLERCRQYKLSIITPSLDYLIKNHEYLNDIKVHLKLNTGMNRLGIRISEAKKALDILIESKADIKGIMSHYACADCDKEKSLRQYNDFKKCVEDLNYPFEYIHIGATDGTLLDIDDISTHIRPGMGILGYSSFETDLKPSVSLYSLVSDCKIVEKDEGISYGHHSFGDGESYILTLPIGYGDGFIRANTGKKVYIDGEYGEIVGSICMDQMMVKVKKAYEIESKVEILGPHIDIDERARELGTINYEIITLLSDRLYRVYKEKGEIIRIIAPRFQ